MIIRIRLILIFILYAGSNVIAQKNIIQNGCFEDNGNLNIPKGYYSKMAESVKFWSSYSYGTSEISKLNNFIGKKDRSVCFAGCPTDTAWFNGGNDNCLGIKEGKYSARFAMFNVEHPINPHGGEKYSTIGYIVNELSSYRKEGIYKLQFSGVIRNGGLNNPFFNHFYKENRKFIQEKIDLIKYGKPCPENKVQLDLRDTINEIPEWWYCEPSESNMLKTTILFTNTLPEGELYNPNETDLYIDTLLQTDCSKGWSNYIFEFDLKARYKYFVIGYLPREKRNDEKLCPGDISFSLDEFSLTYLRKIEEN